MYYMNHVETTYCLNDVMTTRIESHGFISMELHSCGAKGPSKPLRYECSYKCGHCWKRKAVREESRQAEFKDRHQAARPCYPCHEKGKIALDSCNSVGGRIVSLVKRHFSLSQRPFSSQC